MTRYWTLQLEQSGLPIERFATIVPTQNLSCEAEDQLGTGLNQIRSVNGNKLRCFAKRIVPSTSSRCTRPLMPIHRTTILSDYPVDAHSQCSQEVNAALTCLSLSPSSADACSRVAQMSCASADLSCRSSRVPRVWEGVDVFGAACGARPVPVRRRQDYSR